MTDRQQIHDRRWGILGVLILSLLVVVLDTSILNVALKTLAEPKPKGLGASQVGLEWALNSYTLAFAGFLFTWGILGDRLGRKRMLLGGIVAFGISSLLCAYAQSTGELIAFRALMGISGAAVLPSTLSIISNVFEPEERPKAIGLWAGAVGLALAIGPITGGLLLAHFWWGSVFLVNVPICVIALGLMLLLVPESRDPEPGRLDPVGVGLQVTSITGIVFAIVRGGDTSFTSLQAIVPFLLGLGLAAAFIAWEKRASSPVLDIELFRDRRFSAAVGVIALVFCAYMGLVFVISFYLQAARGYTPLHSGALLIPLAAGQMISSSRSATLVVRFGVRTVVTTGLALLTVAFIYYTQATATSSALLLVVVLAVQGVAIGAVMPPVTSTIMAAVPREKAGAGSAIGNTSRQVGGCLGVAILGAVLGSAYRSGIDPHLVAAHLPASAGASITATLAAAAHLGAGAHVLEATAIGAFVTAMHHAAIGSAVIGLIGVICAVSFLPRRIALAGGPGGPPAEPEVARDPVDTREPVVAGGVPEPAGVRA